jgi:hypothetical protein
VENDGMKNRVRRRSCVVTSCRIKVGGSFVDCLNSHNNFEEEV